MRIDPTLLIYGVAPKILVDCAAQLHDEREFDLNSFCRALGAPAWESIDVLQCLVRDGFVTVAADRAVYLPTTKFNQLALATLGGGISRAEADQLLAAVIAQAERINADPQSHRCTIDCIAVFGSYLTGAETLGDLDIGVSVTEHRLPSREEAMAEYRAFIAGRRTCTDKAMSLLRLRKPKVISLHKLGEVVDLGTPFRVVFGTRPTGGAGGV